MQHFLFLVIFGNLMFYPAPQVMALRRSLHAGVLARWRWLGAFQKGGLGLHTPGKPTFIFEFINTGKINAKYR
jgi:hypothetical protein